MKKHAAGDNMVFNNAILYAFPLYDEPFVLCKLLQAILLFSITRICHKVLRIYLCGNCTIPVTHPHALFCVAVSPFRYITLPKDNPNRRRLTCCGCFTDLHAIYVSCVCRWHLQSAHEAQIWGQVMRKKLVQGIC